MKPYFAEFIKEPDVEKDNIFPSEEDFVIGGVNKPAKLFLCSRDIQVGDKVFHDTSVPNQGFIWTESHNNKMRKDDVYKVIGEISPDATWVKEGDKFNNSQLIWQARNKNGDIEDTEDWAEKEVLEDEYGYYTIGIKGPCGHFH